MTNLDDTVNHIRAAAFLSVGRACMFAALGIWAVIFGFITWPVLALRIGAVLTTLTGVVLIYKALEAPMRPYRRTEVWILIGKKTQMPESEAQAVISGVLREMFWKFASYAAAIALGLWIAAILVALVFPNSA